jgi:hypothetical protein
MKDDKAQAILDSWSNLRDRAIEDLAYLMEVQDIKHIVCQSYTPSFNDGDPCEQTVQFIGKPNCVHEDYFVYLDKEGNPVTINDLKQEDLLTELREGGVDETVITALQKWLDSSEYYPPTELVATYPLEGFESFLWNICEIVFPTDTLAMITLNEDGTVGLYTEDYDCGY